MQLSSKVLADSFGAYLKKKEVLHSSRWVMLGGQMPQFEIPQTELAMRGSYGLVKGPLKHLRALVVHFDQKKTLLGDTCSRLA